LKKESGPKIFYNPLSIVAKHYRMSEIGRHKVQRHYTVACCMNPDVYGRYLAALKGEVVKKEELCLGESPGKTSFTVTAKNYKIKGGLSARLNESDLNTIFEV